MHKDGIAKVAIVVALSAAGFFAVVAMRNQRRKQRAAAGVDRRHSPRLRLTESGRVEELESFPEYVARQIGIGSECQCPQLGKLASGYLMKTKGGEEQIYTFFADDPNPEAVCLKLIDELDKCILGYFAFHWTHASLMINKVLSVDSHEPKKKLKNMVLEATRKMRFERITKNLKVTRLFSTLVEEMKAIGLAPGDDSQRCTEVMVPAAKSERSPVLLLMGGGMGAGKSTVLKDIMKDPFWSGTEAVVVEADAFKESDVIYRAISSRGHHHDIIQTAELVHQSSTDAASSLLVTALNEGRDVIMDGTLSWAPFVEQTIAMARSVHHHRYRMGVGYKVADDGTVTENYWERVGDDDEDRKQREACRRKPYRIELVGVVCDAYLAVVRGIRRAILVGRAVRVKSQLTSHKRFACAFPGYCKLVDNARLYCTNSMASPPKLIGWKDASSTLLVDSEEIECLSKVSSLNEDADSVYDLYTDADTTCGMTSVWDDVVLSPLRDELQRELRVAIQAAEKPAL